MRVGRISRSEQHSQKEKRRLHLHKLLTRVSRIQVDTVHNLSSKFYHVRRTGQVLPLQLTQMAIVLHNSNIMSTAFLSMLSQLVTEFHEA